jgi:hypothetical protein
LRETLDLADRMKIRTIIVEDLPEIGWNVPATAAIRSRLGLGMPAAPSLQDVTNRASSVSGILGRLARDRSFSVVSLTRDLCTPICKTVVDRNSVYADDDHVSVWGARHLVGPIFVERLSLNATGATIDARRVPQ